MKLAILLVGTCAVMSAHAQRSNKRVPVSEAVAKAQAISALMAAPTAPFHLKANIVEETNPDSEYRGTVEQWWTAPDRYRRVITTPGFSQTLIVNGDERQETDTGDYFPHWLENIATALVDPLPMADAVKTLQTEVAGANGNEHFSSCVRTQGKSGTAELSRVTYNVFCFSGTGRVTSVATPFFGMEFKDPASFAAKLIARRLEDYPEPGTKIVTTVQILDKLDSPDDTLFSITNPTPARDAIRTVVITQASLDKMRRETPDLKWPPVGGGRTTGVVTMKVVVDRHGNVREAWPYNSDNNGIEDTAREQVRNNWKFKPAVVDGVPVQVATVLVVPFSTTLTADTTPVLNDAEARQQATNIKDPTFPKEVAKGKLVRVKVSVNEKGEVAGVGNVGDAPMPEFMAAYGAVRHWNWKALIRDGKAVYYHAIVEFRNQ